MRSFYESPLSEEHDKLKHIRLKELGWSILEYKKNTPLKHRFNALKYVKAILEYKNELSIDFTNELVYVKERNA